MSDTGRNDWAGRFRLYDGENPQVYALFKGFAEEALAAGERVGAKCIYEQIRWRTLVQTKPEPGMPRTRINNNYVCHFARKLYSEDPTKWEGFFDFRDLSGIQHETTVSRHPSATHQIGAGA